MLLEIREMELMDKKTEAEMVDAVVEAIKLANDGMTPSRAVAKVATDKGYGKPLCARMVEAFNVSATRRHQHDASGEAKAAAFPLAAANEVYAIMYPDVVPSPAEKQAQSWVPDDSSDNRFFRCDAPAVEKLSADTEVASCDPDIDILMTRALKQADSLKRSAAAACEDVAYCREKMSAAIESYVEHFNQLYSDPIEKVAVAAVASRGERCRSLFETIHARSRHCKTAFELPQDCSGSLDQPHAGCVDKIIEATDNYVKAVKAARLALKTADDFVDRVTTYRDGLAKSAAGPLEMLALSRLLPRGGSDPQDVLDPVRHELPDIESDRMTIRAQMALRELMDDDPVLSQADPYSVVNAFNEIATLAPSAVGNVPALRALLRKAVEQESLDPHDITALSGMQRGFEQTIDPGMSELAPSLMPDFKPLSNDEA